MMYQTLTSGSDIQHLISELFLREIVICFINVLHALVFRNVLSKTKGLPIISLRNKLEQTFK